MTYVVDVTLSLIRVLDRAAFLKDSQQFVGFAANASFWADEVRHALDIIGGYELRLSAWNHAVGSIGGDSDAPISPEDIAKLSRQLRASATRFFRLCERRLDRGQVDEIEQLLGLRIKDMTPQD